MPDKELGSGPMSLLYLAKVSASRLALLEEASDLVGVAWLPRLDGKSSCLGDPKAANLLAAARPAPLFWAASAAAEVALMGWGPSLAWLGAYSGLKRAEPGVDGNSAWGLLK